MPNETFAGTVAFKAYQLDPETRTLDARVVVANPGLRLRPGMFADVALRIPVTAALLAGGAAAASPTTAPATAPDPAHVATAYAAALGPYLKANKLLSEDKAEGVPGLLQDMVNALGSVKDADAVRPAFGRLAGAAKRNAGPAAGRGPQGVEGRLGRDGRDRQGGRAAGGRAGGRSSSTAP